MCPKLNTYTWVEGINDDGLSIKDKGIAIAVQTGKNVVEYVEYHGHKAIREYVRLLYRLKGMDSHPKACYHHIDAPDMDGIEVEVHYRPTFCRSFIRNKIGFVSPERRYEAPTVARPPQM